MSALIERLNRVAFSPLRQREPVAQDHTRLRGEAFDHHGGFEVGATPTQLDQERMIWIGLTGTEDVPRATHGT